ncbi:haloacid dehalogenase-like hydrolase domain-containing protein 2 isoform X2 [Zootermopsis nevadensis]|uniref:haloacid dehalogenase-like hydrolase domain-containing protein 2 isoform X2 n=1 Tax=Zootermopsis nevadensis TaxID=136037 RepID=UPI000B8E8272|nr:haloacid dehalogenase-like hydrolase domain-containing protein 2 isoform X2 [Zootermopsis nevadensis]
MGPPTLFPLRRKLCYGFLSPLEMLRGTGIPIKFVTNTTKESRRCLFERLIGLGLELRKDEIWSSLWAAQDLLRSRNLKPMLMVDDAALEDFSGLTDYGEEEQNAVVIGLAPSMFNFSQLSKAFRLLLTGAGVPLIAIHCGRYYKRCDGLALGPGPFVRALEYASGCHSEVVGKPSPTFFRSALGDVDPAYAVMIGDDVKDDIGGAQAMGMRGFLVQTGKYRTGDESRISPGPAAVCPSFSEAVDILLKEYAQSEGDS